MTVLSGLALPDVTTGRVVDLGSFTGVLVAVRHHGWLPCHRHLGQVQRLAGDVPVVAVGFDPAPLLAAVAAELGWRGPFLADPERSVYRRLGLRRAPWWRIWSPRTVLFYARAGRRDRPSAPSDVRQMGGDAVIVDGAVVACWRPRTPVDRVDPAVPQATARQLRTGWGQRGYWLVTRQIWRVTSQ